LGFGLRLGLRFRFVSVVKNLQIFVTVLVGGFRFGFGFGFGFGFRFGFRFGFGFWLDFSCSVHFGLCCCGFGFGFRFGFRFGLG